VINKLESMKKKYLEIVNKLQSGNLDVKEMTKLMKQQSELVEIVGLYDSLVNKKKEQEELENILSSENDKDMIKLFEVESRSLQEAIIGLENKLKMLMIPKDPNDNKNIIIEIKGAAGGDEGNIFAGDLYRLYSKYAESKGWKIEILNAMEGTKGGFTSIEFLVIGKGAFSKLKYESGVHRVQRVPSTESQGRIHTSTAVVLVLPEAEELEIDVNWDDVRFDTFNSSGPGGQSVNTTKSAVRLTHLPTGVVVSCQEGKSQHENREKAYKLLKARVYDKFLQEKNEEDSNIRKEIYGSGDRSEKIRTYNYPQNRVTDHRINLTLQRLDSIMDGKLDLLILPLLNEFQRKHLLET
jgi:peptide chain release factor 1